MRELNEPLYQRVAQKLRLRIVNGELPVGTLLPTEEQLCLEFEVSRHTVREALRLLRRDGLVSSKRGSGTVVIPSTGSAADVHHMMTMNDLSAFSADTRFDIDTIEMVVADDQLTKLLGRSGESWLRVSGKRFRKHERLPLSWTEYYIHRDYASAGRLVSKFAGPVFNLIEELSGERVSRVDQTISAVILPPNLVGKLEVSEGSPALVVRRSYLTANDKCLQIVVNYHPADRFQHAMSMSSVGLA
jgi:DNA-binding GntR family transcriptional regulator